MGWTEPRDWTQGEFVTPTEMNAHVRDNLNSLAQRGLAVKIGTGDGVIATGVQLYIPIPFSCTIRGWSLAADQVGDLALDVYVDAWEAAPPDAADSIVGSEPPSLVAQQFSRDLELTSWDVDVDAGDVIAIVVDSAATVTSAVLTLHVDPR